MKRRNIHNECINPRSTRHIQELDLPSTSYSSASFDETAIAGATAHLLEGSALEWNGAEGDEGGMVNTHGLSLATVQRARSERLS